MTLNAKLSTFFSSPRIRRDRPAWVESATRLGCQRLLKIIKRLDRLRALLAFLLLNTLFRSQHMSRKKTENGYNRQIGACVNFRFF
jgi:hypothetical protein